MIALKIRSVNIVCSIRFAPLLTHHIGKRLNEFSLIEDQKFIFDKILNIIDEKKIEAVLIAGDVYDKPVPSAEAVTVLNSFLNSLAKRNLKVFVISGNHDSQERIGFGAELISQSGVYMSKPFSRNVETHKIKDEYGEINIYMLPFIKPAMVKHVYEEADIDSYDSAMAYVMEQTKVDEGERNLLIAHQFVRGADRCDSEEVSVGGIDEVSVENFKRFDYVALGHLHSPQHIKSEFVRYSGTPLKYSFSEAKHQKTALIVNMKEKGNITLEKVPLIPKHDMIEIKGKYQEIMSKDFYKDIDRMDYAHVTLTDEQDVLHAMELLRTVYPNIMKLDYDNTRTRSNNEIKGGKNVEKKQPLDLFKEFYELQNNQPMSREQADFMDKLIKDVWEVNE